MTKDETRLLDYLKVAGKSFTWTDILSAPNSAKGWGTRQSRNATTYERLASAGLVRHATAEEISAWYEWYDVETSRIERHLRYAVDNLRWRIVSELADTLKYRTETRPTREDLALFTLCGPIGKTLMEVFEPSEAAS